MTSDDYDPPRNVLVVPVHGGGVAAFSKLVNAFSTVYGSAAVDSPRSRGESFDLALLVSGDEDADVFAELLERNWHIHEIQARIINLSQIVDDNGSTIGAVAIESAMDPGRRGPNGTPIINVKKFLGIMALAGSYDDLIVIDDDAYPVRRLDYLFNWAKANASLHLLPVASAPVVVDHPCGPVVHAGIQRIIPGPAAIDFRRAEASWFFNPPHYPSEQINRFERDMIQVHGSLANFFEALEWGSFDQLVWNEWQVANDLIRPYFLAELLGPTNPPEFLTWEQRRTIEQATSMRSLWCWLGLDPKHPGSADGPLLALHTDRASPD